VSAEREENTDSSGDEQLDQRDRIPPDPVNPWFFRELVAKRCSRWRSGGWDAAAATCAPKADKRITAGQERVEEPSDPWR
jgi:hypothetical protein